MYSSPKIQTILWKFNLFNLFNVLDQVGDSDAPIVIQHSLRLVAASSRNSDLYLDSYVPKYICSFPNISKNMSSLLNMFSHNLLFLLNNCLPSFRTEWKLILQIKCLVANRMGVVTWKLSCRRIYHRVWIQCTTKYVNQSCLYIAVYSIYLEANVYWASRAFQNNVVVFQGLTCSNSHENE